MTGISSDKTLRSFNKLSIVYIVIFKINFFKNYPANNIVSNLNEFDVISKFFSRHKASSKNHPFITLSLGDDCALLQSGCRMQTAISTDTLVSGHHFLVNTLPEALAYKALAVNLSDMAAMGATPRAFLLNLTLPEININWLERFSNELYALADRFNILLVGGDMTRGPLAISITIIGETPNNQALLRSQAQIGDDIWVSNQLGNARAGLAILQAEKWVSSIPKIHHKSLINALERPVARVELGMKLRGIAHAAIDISDGLIGDLQHILQCSQVSAIVNVDDIPNSVALTHLAGQYRLQCMLAGGDDYELCFTVPKISKEKIRSLSNELNISLTNIGEICSHFVNATPSIEWRNNKNQIIPISLNSFDHFHA